MGFGERLRALRGNRNQREVAELCGIPQTTYSLLENQETPPRAEVLEKLSRGFGIAASYFTDERPELASPERLAVLRYVQALRTVGPSYKTDGIGQSSVADGKEEEECIQRILLKCRTEKDEE